MQKRAKFNYADFGNKQALIQSVTISLIVNGILLLGTLHGRVRGSEVLWYGYVSFFLWHFGCNVLLYFLLFRFNFRLIRFSGRFDIKSKKKSVVAAIGTMIICVVLSPVLTRLQWYAIGGRENFAVNDFILYNLVKDLILGAIVILVTRYIYSNYKREQIIIANQKLIEENIRTRFEALKNQLDPHFLFNSLNTLNGLIGVNDEKALEYVDNLSSVFRYTLNNKNIQTLEEELGFVESYVVLLKIRYGENLIVEYDIDEQYRSYEIMPVSIQLLVENAVKHNEISNRLPLTITVQTTPSKTILVSNRINPKSGDRINSGVGLTNLADRYMILFKKAIQIESIDGVFSVEIPLMVRTIKENEK